VLEERRYANGINYSPRCVTKLATPPRGLEAIKKNNIASWNTTLLKSFKMISWHSLVFPVLGPLQIRLTAMVKGERVSPNADCMGVMHEIFIPLTRLEDRYLCVVLFDKPVHRKTTG
jgi:hypothetical protein